ncbi:hypothetical protein DMN91_003981 [Ooceraea biroi]|uniref:H15 domain-containing protein n=2 Tax=Ooceraea biroi TaxID=2015173 RepID=A0A3L8DUC6_OOCBI|nr:uncharacterized protein LOC113561822 [Ooceraea biroi]RLU23773.1 hypothetical protein DMN91_003981 [Ooceraea biroi]
MRPSTKNLDLVISAIKNLRELKGSTSREILRYISYVYDVPSAAARRQMQSVLKRGVAYGILKKTGDSYSLPTDSEIARTEVAVQEIGLLDAYCQRKVQRCGGCRTRRGRSVRRDRKIVCRCRRKSAGRRLRGCGSRSSCSRRRGQCRCRSLGADDVETVDEKPNTKYDLDSDDSTGSDRIMTNVVKEIVEKNGSSRSFVERVSDISESH